MFNNSFNHHLLTHRRIQHGRFSSGLGAGFSISFLANGTICYLTETTEALILFLSSRLHSFGESLGLSEKRTYLLPWPSSLPDFFPLFACHIPGVLQAVSVTATLRDAQTQRCPCAAPAASCGVDMRRNWPLSNSRKRNSATKSPFLGPHCLYACTYLPFGLQVSLILIIARCLADPTAPAPSDP